MIMRSSGLAFLLPSVNSDGASRRTDDEVFSLPLPYSTSLLSIHTS